METIIPLLSLAKDASYAISPLPYAARQAIVRGIADALVENTEGILAANQQDMDAMAADDPMRDRLLLTADRIQNIAQDARNVANLPDPLGDIQLHKTLPNGLDLKKISVPLGVVGMIYEARPNVTVDTAVLCIMSGNAVVLRGGSAAQHSNTALVEVIERVLLAHDVPGDAVTLLPVDRKHVKTMLTASEYIDVIIPRGSQKLIAFVRSCATVPTIETGAGVCHTYVHRSADLAQAAAIVVNAKVTRPSVCNCLDTLLVDQDVAAAFLPMITAGMAEHNVDLYADESSFEILTSAAYPQLHRAAEGQWDTEYLAFAAGVRVVGGLTEALTHVRRHSSKHSEAICATDERVITTYLATVDAAAVYANASTRFTDGAQFGLGAEIGISTQKLHARGPFALAKLTTEKWVIRGNGQIRA